MVLYNFKGGGIDGSSPQTPLLRDASGTLYGTTLYGSYKHQICGKPHFDCGTAFRLTRPEPGHTQWRETVLHVFVGGAADGLHPSSGLIEDEGGNLYGTTSQGGDATSSRCVSRRHPTGSGCGVVYMLSPPARGSTIWPERLLQVFQDGAEDGAAPGGDFVRDSSGTLYGITGLGGPNELGTVYSLTPPSTSGGAWTFNLIYAFKGVAEDDGAYPASLTLGKDGNLYGTTLGGGADQSGGELVFRLSRPTSVVHDWQETILYRFDQSPGSSPYTIYPVSLRQDAGGVFYGLTEEGGTQNGGTLFKLNQPASGGNVWTETNSARVCRRSIRITGW